MRFLFIFVGFLEAFFGGFCQNQKNMCFFGFRVFIQKQKTHGCFWFSESLILENQNHVSLFFFFFFGGGGGVTQRTPKKRPPGLHGFGFLFVLFLLVWFLCGYRRNQLQEKGFGM